MDKFIICYDKTEEEPPTLVIDGELEICLFRGYYFKSSRNANGKLDEWKEIPVALNRAQVDLYLFSELIPAFANNMHDLHTLLSAFPAILEEFMKKSFRFYSRKVDFKVEHLNLTKDSAEALPYKNQLYIRAFVKSEEINPVALAYLVSEDLLSTYRYLPDYKEEINNAIDIYNLDHGTLYGLEQMLFAIDKDFDSKIGLYDASGLRYLLIRYIDWLQAGKQNPEDKLNGMNMFDRK